jgi:hypothetical protein
MTRSDRPRPESDPRGERARRHIRGRPLYARVLLGFFGLLAALFALVCVLIFLVLPWLGERGDLNRLIAAAIRSCLHSDLDVRMEAIETDPLSRLAITHIEGIRTVGAERRFSFSSDRVSILYSPLDLWAGKVQELVLVKPALYLDLDADPASLFRAPEMPPAPSGAGSGAAESGIEVGHFAIQDGDVRLRYAGREFHVDDLDLEVSGIGSRELLSVRLSARQGASAWRLSGAVLPRGAGRFRLEDAAVEVADLDLEPLFGMLAPFLGGAAAGGRLTLRGRLEGSWPDELRAELRTGVAAASLQSGRERWSDGDLELAVDARAFDGLKRAEFDLRLAVGGEIESRGFLARERASLRLVGRYGDEDRGRIVLGDGSSLAIEGLGSVDLSGGARGLWTELRLDLGFALRGFSVSSLRAPPARAWLPPWLEGAEGIIDVDGRWTGAARDPELRLSFRILQPRLPGFGGADGFVQGEVERVHGFFGGGAPALEGIRVRAGGFEAAALLGALGVASPPGALAGEVEAILEAPRLRAGELPESVELRFRLDPLEVKTPGEIVVLEKAALAATLRIAPSSPRLDGAPAVVRVDAAATLRAPELLIGPVYESFGEEPLSFEGSFDLHFARGDGWSSRMPSIFVAAAAQSPATGPLRIEGFIAPDPEDLSGRAAAFDLAVAATALPVERVFGAAVRDAFKDRFPILDGASAEGLGALDLRASGGAGALRLDGRVRLARGRVSVPAASIAVEGLSLELPVALDAGDGAGPRPSSPGRLAFEKASVRGVELGALEIPFALESGRYRQRGALAPIAALGGRVLARDLEIRAGRGDFEAMLGLRVEGVELGRIGEAAGSALLARIDGRLDADLESVALRGERIDVKGEIVLEAFGGELRLRDLGIRHWSAAYPALRVGAGSIRELRLAELGEAFGFGLASGVLEGELRDLVVLPGAVSRFEISLRTVPRPGVPQYITKNAVKSIQNVLSGPLAAIEEHFFTRFRYHSFGFAARLARNRFQLRGHKTLDGVEYLMASRWWQLPRIDIVNSRPDSDYDWRRILANLKAVAGRGSK